MSREPSRGPGPLLGLLTATTYVFLYAPILVLVALSFNASRLSGSWEGATLAWYWKAAGNPLILASLRNSLLVGGAAAILATAAATAAALAFHRHRFRRQGLLEGLLVIPTVAPEIVLAASLLLLFAAAGLRLGFTSVILSHVAFTVSYAFVVVKARIAGFDHSLEEAAIDLGAGPVRTLLSVTLPALAPAVIAAALLVFALSIDDYVVTSFVAGVGSSTLPLQIYSMVKSGVSPEINAVSTLLLVATGLLLVAVFLIEQGRALRTAALPAAVGPRAAGGALRAVRRAGARERRSQPLHLVELHRPRDDREVRGPPRRQGERRPLRLERGAARQAPGRQRGLRRRLPVGLLGRGAASPGPAAAARPLGAAAPAQPRSRLPRPRLRPGQRPLGALLLGHERDRLQPQARASRCRAPGARSATRATEAGS